MTTLNYCQRMHDNMEPASYYAEDNEPDWDNMSDELYNWHLKQLELYN